MYVSIPLTSFEVADVMRDYPNEKMTPYYNANGTAD